MRTFRARIAVISTVTALLAGCGYDETPLPEPKPAEQAPSATPADCTTTEADLASYAPSDEIVPGGKVEEIRDRGRLIVGVSADTFRMASRNPETNRIEGFDIEFARRIGEEIFRDVPGGFNPGKHIQFKVITAAKRIELLESGDLDLVVRNFTITCDRWERIAFSQVYYNATQKVLLPKDLAATYRTPADLAGLRVCAPIGSTSLVNIKDAEENAILEPASNHTGCLVKFQRGEVDAITGDDTVLAGLAAQDPYAVVPEQDPFSDEPYGIGANIDDVDLVRFVNAVIDEMRDDDSWQRAYNNWLKPYLAVDATPPAPVTPYRTE